MVITINIFFGQGFVQNILAICFFTIFIVLREINVMILLFRMWNKLLTLSSSLAANFYSQTQPHQQFQSSFDLWWNHICTDSFEAVLIWSRRHEGPLPLGSAKRSKIIFDGDTIVWHSEHLQYRNPRKRKYIHKVILHRKLTYMANNQQQ